MLAIVALVARLADPSFQPPPQAPPPAGPAVADVAVEAGLTPEVFAVAGMTPQQAQSALAAMGEAVEIVGALSAAHSNFAARSASLLAAEAALLAGPGEPGAVAARDAAIEQVELATELLANVRKAARAISLGGLPPTILSTVEAQASSAGWIVPTEFRVLDRTEEEWRVIETALRSEARAARSGGALDEAQANLLASIRADPIVMQAKANLEAGLEAMSQVIAPPG